MLSVALVASIAGAEQQTKPLIPVRGVPFGPVLPQPVQQQLAAPAAQAQPQPQPLQSKDPSVLQPPLSQQPLAVPAQQPISTKQPTSLLPSEIAARQAAAVAASVVPPEKASEEVTTLAGEYSYGNGFNMNCILEIAPDGRFLYKRCDCEEVVDNAAGSIKLDDEGQVVLEPARPREAWPRGTAPVMVPVAWGQRLYLVPEDDMLGFVNQVNRGIEPVTRGSMGSYYLREGDWDRPVSGLPDLPEKWKELILEEPLHGLVAGKDPAGRWIVDLGQKHGVYDRMELSAWSANRRRFVTLRVTETGTDTSAVELVEAPPGLAIQGWNVYSRVAPPASAEPQ